MFKKTFISSLTAAAILLSSQQYAFSKSAETVPAVKPGAAIEKLLEGNNRFVSGRVEHPNQSGERRTDVFKNGQHPYAVILTCSDSRVPPEVLFDCGIGDIFVIRTAGNVIDDVSIGSIEYAVEHLGTPIVIVMGHKKCGAVDATIAGGEIPGHIKSIAAQIKPAVLKAKASGGEVLDNAVKNNVELIVEKLKHSKPIISEFAETGKVQIIGAYYDLENGKVELLKNKNEKKETGSEKILVIEKK
ncbi:MAG: carbonic anhydrase [Candidatus Wallbacteria bacterium]